MFYHYRQNKSGGSFDTDTKDGIAINVIIEADNPKEADTKLIDIGGYFDGCEKGIDCPCCGDRWYETDNYDAKEFPHIYGTPVNEYVKSRDYTYFGKEEQRIVIHYKNGNIEWY